MTGEEVYSTIYAMIEARNEKGVIWVGANDGPVHVSRDNGKTWKNVTPKGLVGARIQNIEDSPHARGRAYIAAYRFLREHDFKPYIYRTDDYGATWTLLTDGKNGIPDDYPTRVVREDPRQPGLLYAGTEFGFFVSFNAGKNWQPLQNEPAGDAGHRHAVHRNDLVISTMGRSAWIMDNVTPLQQLAAIAQGTPRAAAAGSSAWLSGPSALADASADPTSPGGSWSAAEQAPATMPAMLMFAPRETVRLRNSSAPSSGNEPEYPARWPRSTSTSRMPRRRTRRWRSPTRAAGSSNHGVCSSRGRAPAADRRCVGSSAAVR